MKGVLSRQKSTKIVLAGALPRTPLEELTTPPTPSSQLGRGKPLPIPLLINAFGVSVSTPAAPRFSRLLPSDLAPQIVNPGTATVPNFGTDRRLCYYKSGEQVSWRLTAAK